MVQVQVKFLSSLYALEVDPKSIHRERCVQGVLKTTYPRFLENVCENFKLSDGAQGLDGARKASPYIICSLSKFSGYPYLISP